PLRPPVPGEPYRDTAVHVVQTNLRTALPSRGPHMVAARSAPRLPDVRIDTAAQIARFHIGACALWNEQTDRPVHGAEQDGVLRADPAEPGLELPVDGGKVGLAFEPFRFDTAIDRGRLDRTGQAADRKAAVDQLDILQVGIPRNHDPV